MTTKHRIVDRAGLLLLALALAAAPAAGQSGLGIDGAAVELDGATAGGEVAWLGVGLERPEWTPQLLRWAAVTRDEDRDGRVALELGRKVPDVSVWAAVDIATGRIDMLSGPGTRLREVEFPERGLGYQRGGALWLSDRRPYLELLVVRPGEGAWALSVGDGGEADEDRSPDGVSVPALAQMRRLAASTPELRGLRAKDVVVVIDPQTLEHYVAEIGNPH